MGALIFWGVVLLIICGCGWWYRYTKISEMADRFGLDKGDLMMKDVFGADGAVDRELATVALERAEEVNRRADREAAARRRQEANRRQEAERAEAERAKQTLTNEVTIKPADRPREVRLQELMDLETRGLITPEIAATRRNEILDEI
jgi:sRNA-binding protein